MSKLKKTNKSLTAVGLAIVASSGVWSFGNITNGFGYFNGTQVIGAWLIVFILYFLPYSLMVGELGSVFKNTDGGVGFWCFKTIGPKIAFLTGWIYWVVHMPYLTQKANQTIVSLNWAFSAEGSIAGMPVVTLQLLCLAIFLVGVIFSLFGVSIINSIAKIAGWSMLIMMILYIVLIFAAPIINPNTASNLRNFSIARDGIFPDNISFLFNISILVLSVGGCEKFAPYIKTMKNPGKNFPKGMFLLVILCFATAVLGTIAINSFYCGQEITTNNANFIANGQYDAFIKVGELFGLGKSLMYLYAITNAIVQFAAIIISIDAPLRILLGNKDTNFIPKWLFKQNKYGSYTHGILVVTIVVSVITLIPCLGIGDANNLVKWLIDLNSVCMPLRYLFVFSAFIALKINADKFINKDYVFIKNKKLAIFVGCWCFLITFIACLMKIISAPDSFQLIMNFSTPLILGGIGFLMPLFIKRNKQLSK